MYFFPCNLCYKITCPKHFVTAFFEVFLLIVINADKDNPILRQQISCKHQSRINE